MKWYLHFLIVADNLLTYQMSCDANTNLVTCNAFGQYCYEIFGLKMNMKPSVYESIYQQSIPIVYPGIENIYKNTSL